MADLLLFDRRCRLTIANPVTDPKNFRGSQSVDVIEINGGTTDQTDVPGMRVKFKIDKSLKKEPNTSEIIVTNLSPTTRASLQKVGVKVLLEAGYKETGVTRLFAGDVRTTDHVRDGANWNTTMKLGDGERAWRYARVSASFSPGTRASDAVRTVAESMGIDPGNLQDAVDNIHPILDQGWAACGNASRALDQLMKSLGKEWSVQDGALQILDPYTTIDQKGSQQIPEISPSTGLVGSPEMGTPPRKSKPALLKFKSLLIPGVRCGGQVKLLSERYNGAVRVEKLSYEGDTHGGDWYVQIDGTVLR